MQFCCFCFVYLIIFFMALKCFVFLCFSIIVVKIFAYIFNLDICFTQFSCCHLGFRISILQYTYIRTVVAFPFHYPIFSIIISIFHCFNKQLQTNQVGVSTHKASYITYTRMRYTRTHLRTQGARKQLEAFGLYALLLTCLYVYLLIYDYIIYVCMAQST